MRNSQENDKHNRTARKVGVAKSSGKEAQGSARKPKTKTYQRPTLPEESTSSLPQGVLTQEDFRTRVSQKAFELYEIRRAMTDVEDWIEAERVVKLQLLSEEQGAGSV